MISTKVADNSSVDENTAFAIADQLASEAIWSGDQCTFVGAVPAAQLGAAVPYASTGADVYEGTAGIARFLFCAARVSNSELYQRTASGAMRHAITHANGTSLFSGGTGVALVALESELREFRSPGLRLLEDAVNQTLADPSPPADLLSGIAGIIVGITNAWPLLDSSYWSKKVIELAHKLLDLAVPDTHGLKWPLYPGSVEYLCGLAHGASGVAMAFERVATVDSDRSSWLRFAADARRFERQYYSPQHGSWADLRSDVGQDERAALGYPHMWCHGSIGIAAERLFAHSSDIVARAEKIAAIEAVRANLQQASALPGGPGGSDVINGSCCHGLSGSIDLMLDCASLSDDPTEWISLARQGTAIIRDDARRPEGWRCGIPGGHRSPGLMLGIAGIGWTLLRSSRLQDIASVWRIGNATRSLS